MVAFVYVSLYRGPWVKGRWLSMAICKEKIRSTCAVGDWIVGVTPKPDRRLLFVFRVDERLEYGEYWNDTRFRDRRPADALSAGDNMYMPVRRSAEYPYDLRQIPSQHSFIDRSGRVVQSWYNFASDLKGRFVLLSTTFWYFGSRPRSISGSAVRRGLRMDSVGRGHAVVDECGIDPLLRMLPLKGCHGEYPTPLSPRVWGWMGFTNKRYTAERLNEIVRAKIFVDCKTGQLLRGVDIDPMPDKGHLLWTRQGRNEREWQRLEEVILGGAPSLRKWLPRIRALK